jgi:hypothetical protein
MEEHSKGTMRSLLIVVAIALSFLAWGLLIFFSVGDKGSPPWDFGIVEDIPGESAYSTHPLGAPEPTPQHVFQKPPQAEVGGKKGK